MGFSTTLKVITNHPLNKEDKFRSVINYFKWHVGSRLQPYDVVYPWINDVKVFANRTEQGITGSIFCGLHEFKEMALLLHILRPEDLFIDVGANIGSYTMLASKAIGADTICFEPSPNTFKRLVKNIKLNNIEGKVVAKNIAVGDQIGSIHFSKGKNAANHIVLEGEDEDKISVPVSTLDSEIDLYPLFLKVDVEGFEGQVIEGAHKTLNKESLRCVVMEINHTGERYGRDPNSVLNKMVSYGFKPYVYDPFKRHLSEIPGRDSWEGNTIFIRNLEFIEDRIKSAATFKVKHYNI